jgi:hypothetical protein
MVFAYTRTILFGARTVPARFPRTARDEDYEDEDDERMPDEVPEDPVEP